MKCSFLDKDKNLAIGMPPGGCSETIWQWKVEKSSKIQGRELLKYLIEMSQCLFKIMEVLENSAAIETMWQVLIFSVSLFFSKSLPYK